MSCLGLFTIIKIGCSYWDLLYGLTGLSVEVAVGDIGISILRGACWQPLVSRGTDSPITRYAGFVQSSRRLCDLILILSLALAGLTTPDST